MAANGIRIEPMRVIFRLDMMIINLDSVGKPHANSRVDASSRRCLVGNDIERYYRHDRSGDRFRRRNVGVASVSFCHATYERHIIHIEDILAHLVKRATLSRRYHLARIIAGGEAIDTFGIDDNNRHSARMLSMTFVSIGRWM